MTKLLLITALIAVAAFTAWRTIDAQVSQPLPATICYRTDGRTAHIEWMVLGPLQPWYRGNEVSVIHEVGRTVIRNDLILDRLWHRYLARVEN